MVARSNIPELLPGAIVKLTPRKRTKPSSNFKCQNDYYMLSIAAPGYKRENFEVKIADDVINIKAAKTSTPQCNFGRCEYDFTNWKRSFVLPSDADPILASARYQNGELIIILAKSKTSNSEPGEYTIHVY